MTSTALQSLLSGARVTVTVTFYAVLLGTAIGLVGGLSAFSQRRVVRWITVTYVEVFRGVAALILLYWAYFTLPTLFGIELSPLTAGVLALGTNMGAYATEIARGAIGAVPKGQFEASTAVNLTRTQRNLHVVLPQAAITMLPPFGNLCIEVLKASALVSLINMRDIVERAQNLRSQRTVPNSRFFGDEVASSAEIFGTALLIYFAISLAIAGMTRLAERNAGRWRQVGGRA